MKKKLPKQPKAKKLPKKPKASASLTVWENYQRRALEVHRENEAKLAAWKKKVAQIHADEKKRQAIIKKHIAR